MKIKLFISQALFLLLILNNSFPNTFAQNSINNVTNDKEQRKNDVDDSQKSLQGLTEASLIEGKPVLRILSQKSGSTEVRLQQRDNEDALVFSVSRVARFGFGYKPKENGSLIITKTRVIYFPNLDKEQFFNILTSDVKNLKLNVAGLSGILAVNFEVKNDKKLFIYSGLQINNKDVRPALEFLFRSVEDFERTLLEFNKLTESVRPKEEEEEDGSEEESQSEFSDKYDRFKDVTIVSTPKLLVKGSKRSIRTYAEYSFAGKSQQKPEKITLYFYVSATRPIFREFEKMI